MGTAIVGYYKISPQMYTNIIKYHIIPTCNVHNYFCYGAKYLLRAVLSNFDHSLKSSNAPGSNTILLFIRYYLYLLQRD